MKRTVRYLLDTDTCIYLLNGVARLKMQIAQMGVEAVAVAIVTKGELYFGAYHSSHLDQNRQRIHAFFADPGPAVLPLNNQAMDCFGKCKAELRRTGRPIGDVDLLIAAVAISRGLTLVTNNTKHFNRIPGISLENWLLPVAEPLPTPDAHARKDDAEGTHD